MYIGIVALRMLMRLDDWRDNHKGNTGPYDDFDEDYIPNQTEQIDLYGTYGYNWQDKNTHEEPGVVDDNEDWNCQRNKDFVGDHSKDWANPGKNYDSE